MRMRGCWTPGLCVILAVASAGCGRGEGASTAGGDLTKEEGGPDVSTRVVLKATNGEARSFVRGPLHTQYVAPEAVRLARACLRGEGTNPDSVRIEWALHSGTRVRGTALGLQDGVPNPSAVVSFDCADGTGSVNKVPVGSPLSVPTVPTIPFEDAARTAIPVLQRGYSWLRREDYVVDLVVDAHPLPGGERRVALAWIVGRSGMPREERVAVDARTGAFLHGGPHLLPTTLYSRCDMPPGEPACDFDTPPVCAHVDTGIRCASAPCPESSKRVDADDACEACALRGAMGYWNTKCADLPPALW